MKNIADSSASLLLVTLDALMARPDFDFRLEAFSTSTGTYVLLEERRSRARFSTISASSALALSEVVTEAVKFVAACDIESSEDDDDARH